MPTPQLTGTSKTYFTLCCFLLLFCSALKASKNWLEPYELEWTSPSKHASESMPCGGGDVGLNVWVENGDILIYLAKSDAIDEAGLQPKLGRLRIQLSPNPFTNHTEFSQVLNLREGCVEIMGENYGIRSKITIWVDVKRPVINIDIASNHKSDASVSYENWHQDDVSYVANTGILFYHQNRNSETSFDELVNQQGLSSVKGQLNNPLNHLVYGGMLRGTNMKADSIVSGQYAGTDYMGLRLKSIKPATRHRMEVVLHTQKAELLDEWDAGLAAVIKDATATVKTARKVTKDWWEQFWERSYIRTGNADTDTVSSSWKIGRDYQLFRFLMACNAQGSVPTNARGGLFSFDSPASDSLLPISPDVRSENEKGFTAQRQLLTYWPFLKSGDFDILNPQLDFYVKNVENAYIRTKTYWNHTGAYFPERLEVFGLPVASAYGSKRPSFYDPGVEYNTVDEYHWDNVLSFCLMMLDRQQFTQTDNTNYLPFIESCLRFFDVHYQYLSERRTTDKLDADGRLVVYPGSSGDTYKVATNATSTISGLKAVLGRLSALDSTHLSAASRLYVEQLSARVPTLSYTKTDSSTVIAPAKSHERKRGSELPQLYPVFPYELYGIGKPDLQVAMDTWKKERGDSMHVAESYVDRIYTARLGLGRETLEMMVENMVADSSNSFPIFWSEKKDGTPDIDRAGSTAIALQEMLLQTDGTRILLFPAWPKENDVTFKLHAPFDTTVEVVLKNGEIKELIVTPESRLNDVVNLLKN